MIPVSSISANRAIISVPGTLAAAPPSKAGPAAVAVQIRRPFPAAAISPLVPKSINSLQLSSRHSPKPQASSPAAISAPTKADIPGRSPIRGPLYSGSGSSSISSRLTGVNGYLPREAVSSLINRCSIAVFPAAQIPCGAFPSFRPSCPIPSASAVLTASASFSACPSAAACSLDRTSLPHCRWGFIQLYSPNTWRFPPRCHSLTEDSATACMAMVVVPRSTAIIYGSSPPGMAFSSGFPSAGFVIPPL